MVTTTEAPKTTTPLCVDTGYYTWSCQRVGKYFKKTYNLRPSQWCLDPKWKEKCCDYCSRKYLVIAPYNLISIQC